MPSLGTFEQPLSPASPSWQVKAFHTHASSPYGVRRFLQFAAQSYRSPLSKPIQINVCEADTYLLELVAYIHLNPLRAHLVTSVAGLEHYQWSGHRAIMGHAPLTGHAIDEVLAFFGSEAGLARANYLQFVEERAHLGRRDELVGGGLKRYLTLSGSAEHQAYDDRVLGSGEFVELLWQQTERPEKPFRQLTLDDLITKVAAVLEVDEAAITNASRNRQVAEARGVICFIASRKLGFSGVEIAKALHVSRSAVVRDACRGEKVCSANVELNTLYNEQ